MSAARFSVLRATNSRETADFEVERSASATCAPTGSWVREKRRVETPQSIPRARHPHWGQMKRPLPIWGLAL